MSIHKKINERVTKARLDQIILRVIDLMGKNHTTMQICGILRPELNKSETQIKRYVSKATEVLKKDFERDAQIKRLEMEQSLRKDLVDAYVIFNSLAPDDRQKSVWYKLILETKDRLAKFTPEDIDKNEEQTISITYKEVGKDD